MTNTLETTQRAFVLGFLPAIHHVSGLLSRFLSNRKVVYVPSLADCICGSCLLILDQNWADETNNDPTILGCFSFAQKWGMLKLYNGNLFGAGAPKPCVLV